MGKPYLITIFPWKTAFDTSCLLSSDVDPFHKGSNLRKRIFSLTHCILVDSSTVICWTSPFVILGVLHLFCCFYSTFDGKSC